MFLVFFGDRTDVSTPGVEVSLVFLTFFGDRLGISTPGMFTCGDRWSSDWFMIILSSIVVK